MGIKFSSILLIYFERYSISDFLPIKVIELSITFSIIEIFCFSSSVKVLEISSKLFYAILDFIFFNFIVDESFFISVDFTTLKILYSSINE